MLQIEPLRSLLQTKWERFASKLFLMNFLLYVMYLTIFTTVTFYRKEGQPPFPIENIPLDHLRCVGELIIILGTLRFLYKTFPAGSTSSNLCGSVWVWAEGICWPPCALIGSRLGEPSLLPKSFQVIGDVQCHDAKNDPG